MRSTEFKDPRVSYFWDPTRLTGFEWKEALDMDRGLAWDVYFLYGKNASWGEIPSNPDYWMNQLGIDPEISPRLDGELLSANIYRLMREKPSSP
ncbi:MAG: hypothetical protein ACE5GA_04895 [Candidatus Zixiibacteriota bacterium]